jgi:hypothetical protein
MNRKPFSECPAAYQFAPRTDASSVDAAYAIERFDAPRRGAGALLAYAAAIVLTCAASAFIVF